MYKQNKNLPLNRRCIITVPAERVPKTSPHRSTPFTYLLLELRVQPEVDDWVQAHTGLGQHGGDAQHIVRVGGVRNVACGLCYGDTGVGEPGYQVGDYLELSYDQL